MHHNNTVQAGRIQKQKLTQNNRKGEMFWIACDKVNMKQAYLEPEQPGKEVGSQVSNNNVESDAGS